MFKKKKSEDDYDFGLENDFYQSDDDVELVNAARKKRYGCFGIIIVAAALLIGIWLVYGTKPIASNPPLGQNPTATINDDVPIQVAEGLVIANYDVSGNRTGLYDLQGQEISESASVPNSLPTTITQITLTNLDAIAYPQGAFLDPQSGQLVVFGPSVGPNSHPASDDFFVALRAIYSQEDPGVSIDPTDSVTVQDVRYIGQTESTHFGWVMFEADRVMKTLSMGQDNITSAPVTSKTPGYANMLDLEIQMGDNSQGEVRRRFWFTVPVAEIEESPDGQSMIVSALSLNVETEYLDSNWQTLANQPPDPAGQAFAAQLSQYYDEYEQEFPIFGELKSLAYWTAFAHWLEQSDLPVQPELWLASSPAIYSDAPLTTPALTVTRTNTYGNVIQTLSLWGGVNLGMEVDVRPAKESTLMDLKGVADSFKARFYPVKVESTNLARAFAPVSPFALDQKLAANMEFSISPSMQFKYSRDQWELHLPRLQKGGSAENSYFLFTDPSSSVNVILKYDGRDTKTGVDVFTDRQAGIWLEVSPDGYKLTRGQFQPDGQFSYTDGDSMLFGPDGQILENRRSDAKYVYESGRLINIQQVGEETKISWNLDGTIDNILSKDKTVFFKYENNHLTELTDADGAAIRKIEYDSQGRVYREFDSSGVMERLTRYDAQGRILLQVKQGQTSLYDWLPNGNVQVYVGDAFTPWQEANDQDLGDLKIAIRLRQKASINHILFVRQINGKIVILADERSYLMPDFVLKNPRLLREKLADISAKFNNPNQIVLISSGDVNSVSFQSLFPNAIPLNVEKMNEARILKNLSIFTDPPIFTPETGRVINGVPLREEVVNVDPSQNPDAWIGKKDMFSATITKAGYNHIDKPSSTQIKSALSEAPSVLIVVAHSDGQKLYLPDGTQFDLAVLSEQERLAISARNPLVILLSCDTAASTDGISFAQRLLELGPRMVIAPNGNIKVESANEIMRKFFQNLEIKPDALPAFMDAIKSVYPDWIIPTEDGLEHFFEFRTWRISSNKQEV